MCPRQIALRVLLAFTFVLSFSNFTKAQYRAGIQGVILDTQGAAVDGATVTLTDKETNQTRQTTSDASGVYNFLSLSPGRYTIHVESSGFKKQTLENVIVAAEQTQAVNIKLELGDVTQSITVHGDISPAIDTETGQISGTLTSQEVQNLPSFGRDPFQLLRLAPGVFGDGAHNNSGGTQNLPGSAGPGGTDATRSIFAVENQVQIQANGQRNTANSYQIDGIEVNSLAWGGAAVITPNEESVKEVRITSNSYSAETGRNSGGQVEIVSQNGTNSYHGSLFIKIDRPGLNAYQQVNNPNNPTSVQRVSNRFNQFGGSVGGPIVHNRLFAFFSYETLRDNSVSTGTAWVETPQYLKSAPAGSIANSILSFPGEGASFNKNLGGTCAQVNLSPANCQAVSGGLDVGSPLTSSRGTHDPTFGAPATPFGVGNGLDGIPDIQFVQYTNPNKIVETQYNGRLDFQATSKDLVAFSIYWVPSDKTFFNGQARAANLWHNVPLNYSGALLWDHTFTTTLINEARANVTRWYFNELATNPQEPFGLPLDFVDCIGGGNGLNGACGITYGSQGPGIFYQTTYNIRDTVTKVQYNHTLKFGVDVYKEQDNDVQAGGARPDYVFHNLWDFTNDAPYHEFGLFDPRTGQPTSVTKYIRSSIYAAFLQDDFKVKPNFTVNLGLRWEYFTPLSEKFGNISNALLGPAPDPLTGVALKVGGDLYNSSWKNFGPQIGFAWSPGALPLVHQDMHNHLVIRGGFGIGYNRMEEAVTLSGRSNPPFSGFFDLFNSNILYAVPGNAHQFTNWPVNPNATLTFDPTTHLPITGAPVTLEGIQNNLPTPLTYRFSLETQYDLGHSWVATVGYQGSLSRHFTRQQNENWNFSPLNPRIQNLFFWTNDVNTSYNALLTELQHRFSSSFEIDGQYTFSKSEDNASSDFSNIGNYGTYPFLTRAEWAPSDYDATHNFKIWGVWSPQIFRGRHSWLEKVAGGWTASGIWNLHSGFPWTPTYNVQVTDASGATTCGLVYPNSNYCTVRPAAYLGGALSNYGNPTFEKPLSNFPAGPTAYFTPPTLPPSGIPSAPGVSRNSFRGPRYSSLDFTLGKAFGLPHMPVLGENAKLEIRGNFYNLLNQVNFAPIPNQSIGTIQLHADGTQTNPTPANGLASTTFGQAQNALAGRVVELQARFSF